MMTRFKRENLNQLVFSGLRSTLIYVLVATIIGGAASHAGAAALGLSESTRSLDVVDALNSAPASNASRGTATRARVQEVVGRMYRSKPIEVGANLGQTFLFMITLAGVEMTAQELKKNGFEPSHVSSQQLSQTAEAIAMQIVSDGKLWSGWAGMSLLSAAGSKPAAILAELAASAETRPQLALAIKNSIVGTIGFFGWELGAQLWTEATLLIDDPKDFERISNLTSVSAGSLRALIVRAGSTAQSPLSSDENDLRLSKLMLSNLMSVLLTRDLIAKWMDHTWRLRVATGEFATFVTSAVAAGAIGTAVFPGGGTLVGLMFGMAGAGASLLIPQQVKDSFTSDIQDVRLSNAASRLFTNQRDLQQRLRPPPFAILTANERLSAFQTILKQRRVLRAQLLTIYFEREFIALRALYSTETSESNLKYYRRQLADTLSQLLRATESDEKVLAELLSRSSRERSADQNVDQANYAAVVQAELDRVRDVHAFIQNLTPSFQAEFDLDSANSSGVRLSLKPSKTRDALTKFVELNRFNGFNEDRVVEKWRSTRP